MKSIKIKNPVNQVFTGFLFCFDKMVKKLSGIFLMIKKVINKTLKIIVWSFYFLIKFDFKKLK